jgi:hypothetical protein
LLLFNLYSAQWYSCSSRGRWKGREWKPLTRLSSV